MSKLKWLIILNSHFYAKHSKNKLRCAECSTHCCSSELLIYLPLAQSALGCNASHISHFAQPFIASLSFMGLRKRTISENLMVRNYFNHSYNLGLFSLCSQLFPIFLSLPCGHIAFFFLHLCFRSSCKAKAVSLYCTETCFIVKKHRQNLCKTNKFQFGYLSPKC